MVLVLVTTIVGEVVFLTFSKNQSNSISAAVDPKSDAYVFSGTDTDPSAFSFLLDLYLLSGDETFIDGEVTSTLRGYSESDVIAANGAVFINLSKEKGSTPGTKLFLKESSTDVSDKNGKKVQCSEIKKDDLIEVAVTYDYETKDGIIRADIKKLE